MRRSMVSLSGAALIICFAASSACGAFISRETEQSRLPGAIRTSAPALLLSTESAPVSLPYVVRQEADRRRGILVSYERQGFSGTFIARRAELHSGGGLVAKPNELDMQIIRLLGDHDIRSIEDYAAWLKKHIVYRKDEAGDEWALPEETLARGFGDCEDFAFLNAAVLRVFGYQPMLWGLGGGIHAVQHAVCVFQQDGEYLWFDNSTLTRTAVSSWEDCLRQLVARQGYTYHFAITAANAATRRLADEISGRDADIFLNVSE